MGMMYQDAQKYDLAIESFKEATQRNIELYGHDHLQVNNCYQAIAHAYYQQENFRLALEYQEKSHAVLKKLMPADSEYLLACER